MRQAEVSDVRALVALQREIYREDRWFVGDGAPTEQVLAQRLRSADDGMSLWLVAAEGRNLWGWLELHRLPPHRVRHVATLTLAVSAACRRHGVGRMLLERSYGWAAEVGVRKISLNVRAGNAPAIALYRSEGFAIEGRERDQIRVGDDFEDNIIMAKFVRADRTSARHESAPDECAQDERGMNESGAGQNGVD